MHELGPYRIVRKLSASAIATVYLASRGGFPLAIKLLNAEHRSDGALRARFLREATLASGLSHPNIVRLLDSGEIEGRPYIAMEWLDGITLDALLVNYAALPLREAIDVALQLARALDYVHRKGIVHRDVKPGNLIRVRGSGVVKLADFGIATLISEGNTHDEGAQSAGTLHYMSPEQVSGGNIDARSDLWAVGVILYQLVSGKRPFEANTIAAVLHRIANDGPRPVAEFCAVVPASLSTIIARCLAKDRKQRHQSANALADDLARIAGQAEAFPRRQGS